MSGLHETFSRLLSGDLTEGEEAAARARIASDPEAARVWATLQQLSGDLAELPEEAPPPGLDDAVLAALDRSADARVTPTANPRWGWAAGGLLLAAAALLALWLRAPAPTVMHVVAGDQLVDGVVAVMVGDNRVEIDGLARITVEPAGGVAREWGPNPEDSMTRTQTLAAVGAAAAGAVLTVAVYEGSAVIYDAEASPTVLQAGETHATGPTTPAAAPRGIPVPPERPLPAGATEAQTIAHLRDRVDELEEALQQAEFTGALAQGQLVAHMGEPQQWPDDVRPELQPDLFEERLNAALEANPEANLVELDCSEYPCIAVIEPHTLDDDWEDTLRTVPEAMAEGLEDVGLSVFAAKMNGDDGEAGFMGFVVAPKEDSDRDSEVGARTHYRTDALLEELGRQAMEGTEGE
jgi:hypothetical protein